MTYRLFFKCTSTTFTFHKPLHFENHFLLSQLFPHSVAWLIKSNICWIVKNLALKCRLKTKFTHVFSAISPSRWPKTSKNICFSTMERSPTVATSVASQPSVLLSWRRTCWFTVERSLSTANNATTPAQQLVPSRHTCSHIQERNLTVVLNVSTPAQEPVTSRHTY